MKRIWLISIVFLLLSIFPLQLFAAETNVVQILHDRTITDVYSILTTNIAEAKKAITEKRIEITEIIQNYKDKYESDISDVVTQYRQNYVLRKITALESIKNDYINTMEQEKSMIVDDIKKQLQQSIDEHYESAIDQMLKNIK